LVLNEISGEHKFVEIFNAGRNQISMKGVKLQRNEGASEWAGTVDDVIPAGAYRIFLFNSFAAGLDQNPAYVGWTVSSGISDQQTLRVALVNPSGIEFDVFVRGTSWTGPWAQTVTGRDRNNSYSRMDDGTWAGAEPTAGAANGAKRADIVDPGYLIHP
jgi:hypothetical protein